MLSENPNTSRHSPDLHTLPEEVTTELHMMVSGSINLHGIVMVVSGSVHLHGIVCGQGVFSQEFDTSATLPSFRATAPEEHLDACQA